MSKARNYCFTLNNYQANYRDTFNAITGVKYLVCGEELAPTTGTPHLQGYICFNNPRTLGSVMRLGLGSITVAAGNSLQNYQYCTKTRPSAGPRPADVTPNEVIFTIGVRPLTPEEKGEGEKERWRNIRLLATEGRLDEIEDQIYVTRFDTLQRIAAHHMPNAQPLPITDGGGCGIWIMGNSGVGKSHSVWEKYNRDEVYLKARTKWWDGYRGQEIVLVDDFDKYNVKLGGDVKDWADKWPFHAEKKGGSLNIRPRLVLVTSQYSIEDIWEDMQTRAALNRRFKVILKFDKEQNITNEI